MTTVRGEPSYTLECDLVSAAVTRAGGMLGPVTFRLGERLVEPLSVAPWAGEPGSDGLIPVLRALRGDFFCLPFGANDVEFEGERHPLHGETANSDWRLTEQGDVFLKLSLETRIRPGRVEKEIRLRSGHCAVYSRHTVSEMSGPMSFGHHAMLHFRTEGRVSTSPFGFGQVFPGDFEQPAKGGYCSLMPGARFEQLSSVPLATGGVADLTRYPARDGFEDLVAIYSRKERDFAWTAVTFPEERFLWLCLKDPRVLTGTVLWLSNGGRHYAPWNGRHRRVLGLEEVTSAMHLGLAGSVASSEAGEAGFETYKQLDPAGQLVVNTIMLVCECPPGFGAVTSVEPSGEGVAVVDGNGSQVFAPVDVGFLYRTE